MGGAQKNGFSIVEAKRQLKRFRLHICAVLCLLFLSSTAVFAQSSMRLDCGGCPADKICNFFTQQCEQPVAAPPGSYRCPDGTMCPNGTSCNPQGMGGDRCLLPGSTSCRGSGGREFWCRPNQTCDYGRGTCVDKAAARGGEKLCDDGLTVCPANYQCNPGGIGKDKCLAPGSSVCRGTGGREFWCGPKQACDFARAMCVDKASPREGEKLCADGLTVCPSGYQCNPEGIGRDKCLAPGATQCMGPRGITIWCGPKQTCDYARAMCVDKAEPRAGEKLCADGLTVCPSGYQCNLEGVGRDKCLAPGATQCMGPRGVSIWCGPKQSCDYARAMCVDKPEPGPGQKLCGDGLTICPSSHQCNPNGSGSDKCLAPGATQCMGPRGSTLWCGPNQTCDYTRATCVDKTVPKPGQKLCGDGITVCPSNYQCNPNGVGSDKCLAPGATQCMGPRGSTLWCGPNQICDYARATCVNKPQAAPAQSTPPQPTDYGPVGEHFCCSWFIPALNTMTCGPMQQVARCTAQPQGKALMGHYCNIYKGCTPNGQ